jgi:hypothetical protein
VPLAYLVSLIARRWSTTPMAVEDAPWSYVRRELDFIQAEALAARRPPG